MMHPSGVSPAGLRPIVRRLQICRVSSHSAVVVLLSYLSRFITGILLQSIAMATGIEVAGVALAVFPLLAKGLSQVVSGIKNIKQWKRYKLKLQEYADILESASVCFLDTLEELLGDIVNSDEELALLLETPVGPLWQKPEYDERLRERLGRSYSWYLKTVSTLVEELKTMCEKLGVDNAGGVCSRRLATVKSN